MAWHGKDWEICYYSSRALEQAYFGLFLVFVFGCLFQVLVTEPGALHRVGKQVVCHWATSPATPFFWKGLTKLLASNFYNSGDYRCTPPHHNARLRTRVISLPYIMSYGLKICLTCRDCNHHYKITKTQFLMKIQFFKITKGWTLHEIII